MQTARASYGFHKVHYLTPEQWKNTPSRRNGISEEEEGNVRARAAGMVQEACILLRLDEACMATGQTILHKFYHARPVTEFEVEDVAMACTFLGCKVEEHPRRVRDIVNVFHHLEMKQADPKSAKKTEPLDLLGQAYYDRKQALVETEMYVLKELGFVLFFDHPHKFILNYLSQLGEEQHEFLPQVAWNCVNDSLRTDLCVCYKPHKIACAAIFLGARILGIHFPDGWWDAFDTSLEDIQAVISRLINLYKPHGIEDVFSRIRQGSCEPKHAGENDEKVEVKPQSDGSAQ